MESAKSAKHGSKKKKANDPRDPMTKRLDVIVSLMMEAQRAEYKNKKITKSEQINKLHKAGLLDAEIGRIIGQPRNEVAAVRTNLKRRKSKLK